MQTSILKNKSWVQKTLAFKKHFLSSSKEKFYVGVNRKSDLLLIFAKKKLKKEKDKKIRERHKIRERQEDKRKTRK